VRRALDGAIHAPLGISGDFGLCLHPRAPLKTLAEGVISMTRKRLFRWVLLVTLAEAAGFMVPAAGMALTAASSRPILTLVTMVLAGSVEGAVLGSAQADCLYRWRVLPARRRWVAATSVGAAVAWSLWNAAEHAWRYELDFWDCRRRRSRRPDVAHVFAPRSVLCSS